ncbi:glycoside hydrolase family 2 protein [Edaphobacter dinghuensis]|uniref:Beta-galactosidase n=1 Tax=Edaphobacter dinghuensis TaxID=1560005 RepID=A0A917LX95_9BACT|nr:glycoside hydrolase family 2 TIM barrel-domain containing protein [Edaphobacter dinghuensis]GGG63229.1 beta-galactosidase [Edaphobacter dinghuensis]
MFNRRDFIRTGSALGAFTSIPTLESWGDTLLPSLEGPSHHAISLDQHWTVARISKSTPHQQSHQEGQLPQVTLPHCVSQLSWQKWDPSSWEDLWLYRRPLQIPQEFRGLRLFLHFDRVMVNATAAVNGHSLPQHLGGFLPFEHEITSLVTGASNSLSVTVDSRWSNVPPSGSPKGPASVDYLLPGGINGSVELRAVPPIFIKDVFAKPVNVLSADRRLEINCNVDSAIAKSTPVRLVATLQKDKQIIARTSRSVDVAQNRQDVSLVLGDLKDVILWDTENPHLYDLTVTLFVRKQPLHAYKVRVGFRDARFELDGFFLNGKRLQLFGLNRHELFPYVGFSAPDRAQRHDAEYLRRQLNCNIVRCSHYPQSKAFFNACDELGLMVWEEIPGWQYIGDKSWQDVALQNVGDMVRRDRNHPSIVIWGVRINESPNDPELYRQTREIAKSLDGSRPTSGTMTPSSRKDWRQNWHQDVFAFDDYHAAADGSVGIDEPLPGVPYMIAETVGQYSYGTARNFLRRYRRAGDPVEQAEQAVLHAEAHSRAATNQRCCGVIAWCAFDYASLMNAYAGVKCPGIVDTFRIPKLGASFYLAQVNPSVRPVIEPSFYWNFGSNTPTGPGKHAAIFSNCDYLEVFIDGRLHERLKADKDAFPNLKYPPFFIDLNIDGASKPELRIDGYTGNTKALSRSFSSDTASDRLWLHADDMEIQADGTDATRVAFAVVDKFGTPRAYAKGEIHLQLTGPGIIVGDNPFSLDDTGGVGAIWIKSIPGSPGRITLSASHSTLGTNSVNISSR